MTPWRPSREQQACRAGRAAALLRSGAALAVAAVVLASCSSSSSPSSSPPVHPERVPGGKTGTYLVESGIHKIKHVIIIEQENRSFDSYFGTYPRADGIPMKNGVPTVCVHDPATDQCVAPYHDTADSNGGGPHGEANAVADVNGGQMDGFIQQAERGRKGCLSQDNPTCGTKTETDVMGYHTAAEIPNYWTYAKDFVLDDHMFEPVKSWSLPDHLYMVSAWSALCANASPSSCVNDIVGPVGTRQMERQVDRALRTGTANIDDAWTDITWLLYAKKVSWAYYIETGDQPDCEDDASMTCPPVRQKYNTPGIWNPLPLFEDVQKDHQLHNIKPLEDYFSSARAGKLPAVTWIVPSNQNSEHPPSSVHQGQAYTTALINAAMKSPDWDSTAIFLQWDDWGGFYDQVVPPAVDQNGYGLRVPGLVISPYAKKGFIDHETLSSDAYLKFVEDDFLDGARLNPKTDGRPDPRPDVRENEPELGNIAADFDFSQKPRAPVLLPTNPQTDSPSIPAYFSGEGSCKGCTATPPTNVGPTS
jgi:phospholipase C